MIEVTWMHTTPEVYHAIYGRHGPDLRVFGSCTRMEPDDRPAPYMLTEWGFPDADAPLIKSIREGDAYTYFIAVVRATPD